MPILRWLGFSALWSRPLMTIVPSLGVSKPAIMRRIVVLPQPDGPRKETNSPFSMAMLKSWTTWTGPKDFLMWVRVRKLMGEVTPWAERPSGGARQAG